ncbi:unnamed protein product [Cuscuta epithymum]|uniref:Myb-like domain-containing protein n=1 Tax=Cuscuta epithymum TaxID=186058 RepID=A0AAV0CE39_9ASTE|nr:unnamed protein product [Cuscuta epithymum]CAH9122151.1 unnamed protein product [Cuscuta epithymum]
MEFLTADGRLPDGVVSLPDHFSPFPEPTVELFVNETASTPIFAPCKRRRSVRSRPGRNTTIFPDTICAGDDAPVSYNAGDLGLIVQTPINEEEKTIERPAVVMPGSGIGYSETDIPIEMQLKSGIDAQFTNIISQARVMEADLSFSSDGNDSSVVEKEAFSRRGESTRQKFALFVEDMVMKVMNRQDQMHAQLIEVMEKKEQERIQREEYWKKQEIERAKKITELRSQEISRSLTLLSFIKNLLGEEIQVPSSQLAFTEKDELLHGQEAQKDPSNRRWPKSEVQALITVRLSLDDKFKNGPKGSIWEEVTARMATMGYPRTPSKCKEKWKNINKYYKRMTKTEGNSPKPYKSCSYFRELDILYSKGPNPPASQNDVDDVKEITLECVMDTG